MQTAEVTSTSYTLVCKRCRGMFSSTGRHRRFCTECTRWLEDTRYTHCHRSACDDPANPTKFDEVKDTKYGREYHCPKCNSWINFGILADVFSLEVKKR